jgi:hypothetical protein
MPLIILMVGALTYLSIWETSVSISDQISFFRWDKNTCEVVLLKVNYYTESKILTIFRLKC